MKIKVNEHKLNIHCRGSPWGSRTQQHAYCLCYAHSHHIESHLGKKQPQAKIAIAFLFSQLHFNNVTSHALFYGGHLVMRSKRYAVQNQGITLRKIIIKLKKKSNQPNKEKRITVKKDWDLCNLKTTTMITKYLLLVQTESFTRMWRNSLFFELNQWWMVK